MNQENEDNYYINYYCCDADTFSAGTADIEDRHAESH